MYTEPYICSERGQEDRLERGSVQEQDGSLQEGLQKHSGLLEDTKWCKMLLMLCLR